MAKRGKDDKRKTEEASAPLGHNPFAALAPASESGLSQPPAKSEKEAPAQAVEKWGPKIVLSREKKGRGGKTVTRITGLPKSRLEALAKSMKKSLGCGASVDGHDVLLHGTLTERGAEWLRKEGAPRVIIGN